MKKTEKCMRFISGLLVSMLIMAILLKFFTNFLLTLIVGTASNGAACWYMFKNYQHDQRVKLVAKGAIVGTVFMIITTVFLWIFVEITFQGIAN